MSFASLYKIPQPRGYITRDYLVEDLSSTSSDYFDIQDLPVKVGGGRHLIKLKGNGISLKFNSIIDVEFIDAEGVNIFTEVVDLVDRFGVYYIYFDIYDITARGLGYLHVVGIANFDLNGNKIPVEQQRDFNLRWSTAINIEPFERNDSELIFNEPPTVQAYQIITPVKLKVANTASAFSYQTQSISSSNIQTSYFNNTDLDFQSSLNILDKRLRSIRVNPFAQSTTENSVYTYRRILDKDIQNGYSLPQTNRYNTRLIDTGTTGSLRKDFVGGTFVFVDTPQTLLPNTQSYITVVSQSLQLQQYGALITEVVNDKLAYIESPVVVDVKSNRSITQQNETHIYYQVKDFTGSIIYLPSSDDTVSSNILSQKYVEFTFRDIQPISGEVYRIKASARLGSLTGDYKLLHDQIITPVELLTDPDYVNNTTYAKDETDYRLIGHFTSQFIANEYWDTRSELFGDIDPTTVTKVNYPLADSVRIFASQSRTTLLSTKSNQGYNKSQIYTLSFYAYLDPYVELEVYMSSDVDYLSPYTITTQTGTTPKSFFKTRNNEQTRYIGQYNKFGKLIGKITNDRPSEKYYGKVLFDFATDASGLGRPLFRAKIVDYDNYTGSAYVSECSIKPYKLNGFTPNLVQFATQLPTELAEAITVSQSIDFKFDYFDYKGKQSEYTTYLDDLVLDLQAQLPSNICQDDIINFAWRPYLGAGLLPVAGGGVLVRSVVESSNWNSEEDSTIIEKALEKRLSDKGI